MESLFAFLCNLKIPGLVIIVVNALQISECSPRCECCLDVKTMACRCESCT